MASLHLLNASGVTSVEVVVLRSTDHCGAASKISSGSVSVGAASDAGETFLGRISFAVAPGTYRLCATPLKADGGASSVVSPVEATATVGPGATVEVALTLGAKDDAGVDATAPDAASDQRADARADAGEDSSSDAAGQDGAAGAAGTGADGGAGNDAAFSDGCQGQNPSGFMGDFDGDAIKDCVSRPVVAPSPSLQFHKGLGAGTYQQTPVVSLVPCLPKSGQQGLEAVADLDGDHRDDLLISSTNTPGESATNLPLLLGRTNGTFQCPTQTAVTTGAPAGGSTHVIGDFNGDGRQDIFFVTYTGGSGNKNVHWIALTGAPGATIVTVHDTAAGFLLGRNGSVMSLASSNADADAYADVTVDLTVRGMLDATGGAQTLVLHGNGDATFKCGVGSTMVICPNRALGTTSASCQASGAFGTCAP